MLFVICDILDCFLFCMESECVSRATRNISFLFLAHHAKKEKDIIPLNLCNFSNIQTVVKI